MSLILNIFLLPFVNRHIFSLLLMIDERLKLDPLGILFILSAVKLCVDLLIKLFADFALKLRFVEIYQDLLLNLEEISVVEFEVFFIPYFDKF